MKREQTRAVRVGGLQIGGQERVVIQSMCNTPTKDAEATIAQIQRLQEAGCELVRMSVMDMADAQALARIKAAVSVPLVADIHFDYRLALAALESGVDKIRINPGNIGRRENVEAVVEACRSRHVPIRIGINGGSLEKDIHEKYGRPTAEGMMESARRHVDILESLDFHDIVLSFKSSGEILSDPLAFPTSLNLENFANALNTLNFPQLYANTFLICAASLIFELAITFLSSFALARLEFPVPKVRTLIYSFLILGLSVSPFILLFPVY